MGQITFGHFDKYYLLHFCIISFIIISVYGVPLIIKEIEVKRVHQGTWPYKGKIWHLLHVLNYVCVVQQSINHCTVRTGL